MVITASDIEWRLSAPGASQGDDEASTPANSLGGYMSTTVLQDEAFNNLFYNVTSEQAEHGAALHRCVFIVNTHPTDTWGNVRVWIQSQVPGGSHITIGLDPTGVVDGDDSDPQAVTIADETDAPDGVVFANPTTPEAGLSVGDVGPGQCFAVWVCNVVPVNADALGNDGATLAVTGTTDPD